MSAGRHQSTSLQITQFLAEFADILPSRVGKLVRVAMATNLNESAVKALVAGKLEARRALWDADTAGFGCQWLPPSAARPNGTVSFILSYRTTTGTKRLMTLGRWPAMSAPQARALAIKALAEVRMGGDPCNQRRAGRTKGTTVADVIGAYLGDAALRLKSSTKQDLTRTLHNHVLPILGGREIATLKSSDLKRLQSEVAAGRTGADRKTGKRGRSIVRGGAGSAAKTLRYLKAFLGWAKQHGYTEANIAADITIAQSRTRTRVYTPDEIGRIATALENIEFEQPRLAVQVAALRLIMLTGVRKQEALRLRWPDIDWSAGVLRLPDSKSGAKLVPLGPAVLGWLQRLPRRDPVWVFPGRGGTGPLSDVRGAWDMVRAEAGLTGTGLNAPVIHSFRHSMVTTGIESGLSGPLLMAISGHRTPAMLSRYAHVSAAASPVRVAAAALAGPMAAALGIGTVVELAPVVELGTETPARKSA